MMFQQLLGTELPIIQAPMAGVQGSALAIAVSNAGGLGSLPCAMLDADSLRRELKAVKLQCDKPFNVNFFCHESAVYDAEREAAWRARLTPYYREFGIEPSPIPKGPKRAPFNDEAAEVLEEFKPDVVSFHFGLPSKRLLSRVKVLGARVIATATTVEEARWLEARGIDAIIAQGFEAGGHRGIFLSGDLSTQLGTFALLPQIVRAVNVPVIAAGGIADAHGVAAALDLGAAGVQVGTSYLLCPEVLTSPLYRSVLKSEAARHTALTNLFTGRPARAIVNRVIRELGPIAHGLPEFPLAAGTIAPLRAQAENRGLSDFSPFWSGQNATGCKEIPAAALTRELAANL